MQQTPAEAHSAVTHYVAVQDPLGAAHCSHGHLLNYFICCVTCAKQVLTPASFACPSGGLAVPHMTTCSHDPTASCLPVAVLNIPCSRALPFTLCSFLQGPQGIAVPHLSSRSGGPTASTGSLSAGQHGSSQLRSAATTATTASGRQSRDTDAADRLMNTRGSTDT